MVAWGPAIFILLPLAILGLISYIGIADRELEIRKYSLTDYIFKSSDSFIQAEALRTLAASKAGDLSGEFPVRVPESGEHYATVLYWAEGGNQNLLKIETLKTIRE